MAHGQLEVNNMIIKMAMLAITGFAVTEIVWQFYKNLKKIDKKDSINEVILFTNESSYCRDHSNSRLPCSRPNCSVANLKKIQMYLDQSKTSLDICMYLLTCNDLAMAIVRAFRRGANVRVIVDAGMADSTGSQSQISVFRRHGIKVRMKRSTFLMHHKFAIVDKSLVLSGSTNWTMQALFGNCDNIIITNETGLVEPITAEFERLWSNLEDEAPKS